MTIAVVKRFPHLFNFRAKILDLLTKCEVWIHLFLLLFDVLCNDLSFLNIDVIIVEQIDFL